MSENFKIIYKILKVLESSMDHEVFDVQRISVGITHLHDVRLKKVLKMLLENGYVSGFEIKKYIGDPCENVIGLEDIQITLKGLEYLEENSLMRKAAELAKGISNII